MADLSRAYGADDSPFMKIVKTGRRAISNSAVQSPMGPHVAVMETSANRQAERYSRTMSANEVGHHRSRDQVRRSAVAIIAARSRTIRPTLVAAKPK